MVLHIVCLGIK